jgi:PAS domain-containing protein
MNQMERPWRWTNARWPGPFETGEAIHGRELSSSGPTALVLPVMVYPHPTRDALGNVLGAVNMLVDITARKRAEESLRESRNAERAHRQELEALTQAAPAAILIARDPHCHHLTGNPTAYQMLRMAPDKTCRNPVRTLCDQSFRRLLQW